MKLSDVEKELGFRVGPQGVEILTPHPIPELGMEVKAVQPNLHLAAAQKLWRMMASQVGEVDMRKREKESWAARAFKEHQDLEDAQRKIATLEAELEKAKSQGLENQRQASGVDAYKARDSFASPVVPHEHFAD